MPAKLHREGNLSEHKCHQRLCLYEVLGQENTCDDTHYNSGSLGVGRIEWTRS